jgi:hypothetical protein
MWTSLQSREHSIRPNDGKQLTVSPIPDGAWNFVHEIARWPILCHRESLDRQSLPAQND